MKLLARLLAAVALVTALARPAHAQPFTAQTIATITGTPQGLLTADLDGDGGTDLVTFNPGTVSLLRRQPDGTYAVQTVETVLAITVGLGVGDLDGDGDLDLVTTNVHDRGASGSISELLRQPDGSFTVRTVATLDDPAYSIAVGDLDGDGTPDLAVAQTYQNTLRLLFRHPGDSLYTEQLIDRIYKHPGKVVIADLDGDGRLDLATANSVDDFFGSGAVDVWLARSDGTYGDHFLFDVGDQPSSLAVGDLDGDGDLDLAVANNEGQNVSLLFRDPAPERTFPDSLYALHRLPKLDAQLTDLALGDLDGDGALDIVTIGYVLAVTNTPETVFLRADVNTFRHQPDGSYAMDTVFSSEHGLSGVVVADLDGDGDLDIAITELRSNAVIALLNQHKAVAVGRTPTGAPTGFALLPAAPNPFNPTTAIRYQLSTVSHVRLDVFDVLGQRVRTLVDETRPAGSSTATFDASGLPSGAYLVRLTAVGLGSGERVTATGRVLLAK